MPAPDTSKEVLTVMNINPTTGRPAGYAMPVCGGGRVASVRVLRVVPRAAAIKGAFPGTSAWSPPT